MKFALIGITIMLVAGGGSYAIVRQQIAADVQAGDSIAKRRTHERELQSAMDKRTQRLTTLLDSLESRLEREPADSMALISAANICYDLGEFTKAAQYYKTYLAKVEDPNANAVRIDYAYTLFQIGRTDEGLGEMQGVLRAEPRNQVALMNMAVMYAQLQRFDDALEWFRKCVAVDSNSDIGKRAALAITQLTSNT